MDHAEMVEHVRALVDRCRSSSSATLAGAGQLLCSLTEVNRVASKCVWTMFSSQVLISRKKLSAAYEISQRANNNILRCLIFAFTTSVHLYGAIDKTLRQLEAGRELARLFGGKDRSDGVGQLALGLWFAEKLKGEFALCAAHEQNTIDVKAMQRNMAKPKLLKSNTLLDLHSRSTKSQAYLVTLYRPAIESNSIQPSVLCTQPVYNIVGNPFTCK
jgi:hypothetical protein